MRKTPLGRKVTKHQFLQWFRHREQTSVFTMICAFFVSKVVKNTCFTNEFVTLPNHQFFAWLMHGEKTLVFTMNYAVFNVNIGKNTGFINENATVSNPQYLRAFVHTPENTQNTLFFQ